MTVGGFGVRKVSAIGPSKANIMVVGGAPGATDLRKGMAFSGADGNILRDAFRHWGIDESKVYFTYLSKYQPPGNELSVWFANGMPKDGVPLWESIPELREEIEAVNPNVIVALGSYALWALTSGTTRWSKKSGHTGVGDWRGSVIEGSKFTGGRKVLVAMDPGSILRQYKLRPIFMNDIGKLRTEATFPEIRRRPRRKIINPVGMERMELMDRYLNSPEPLAFDIEYTPGDGTLICCGFSVDPEESFTITTRSGSDINFVRDMLLSGKPLVAQNGIFDCAILEHWYNVDCLRYLAHDTMIAQHAAYIELPKDLGTLCSLYTDQPCYWTALGDKHWRESRDDSWYARTLEYNAIDAYVTKEVAVGQLADELKDDVIRRTFEFEMSLHMPLWEMSKRGVLVDVAGMKAFRAILDSKEEMLAVKLRELAGREVNVKSGVAVAKLLFTDMAIPATSFTDGNRPKTDDRTLVDVARRCTAEQREVVDTIREIRDCRDLKSKFLDIKVDPDNRLRCHYAIGGTTTGRLASKKFYPTGSGGNLQNIPKDPRIRRVFIPDKGKLFFYNDLKSAESHVVANLTGDDLMLKLHEPGAKPHETTAAMIFGIPPEAVTKDSKERELGKMARHACNYQMGWMRFMQNVNAKSLETGLVINAAQSKLIVNGYRKMHPRLPEWWRRVEQDLKKQGYLSNLLGRRRYFFDRVDASLPTAIAYIPQSTVGDLLNLLLRRCMQDEELREYGVEGLLQVHDAIGGQVDERHVEPAMRRMRDLMAEELVAPTTGRRFVIPVDIAVGPNWADVRSLEV